MKRHVMLGCAVSATLLSMYGCKTPDPMPFDPAQLQRNSRVTAETLPTAELKPIQTTLDPRMVRRERQRPTTSPATRPTTGPALTQDPILRLSLQEVVLRAVNNNMDIRVAGYEPAVNSNRVVEAEARFDPTFFANPTYEWRQVEASTTTSTPSPLPDAQVWALSTGIRQELESGATAELRYETSWYKGDGVFNGDIWANNLVADLKQPLLKNFGREVNRARIEIARNDQRISLLDYRKKLEDTLFEIEQVYWQLMLAEREVEISENLLAGTETTLDLLLKRFEEDVTRVQTAQAGSAVFNRRALLIRARSRVRDLSDQLKRLMNDPELPVASNALILPRTDPISTAVHFDPQDQIDQALEHRLELAQQMLRVDSSSVIVGVARNNILPALNFVQTLTSNGADDYWDTANSHVLSMDDLSYRAGLQFEVPIGNRQAKAIYQRTLLQRQQSIDQYRALVDQVALDVKTALRNVSTSWDEMIANRQAVLASANALDAIVRRQSGEASIDALSPTNVQLRLDSQARLAEAERSEAQAIANYNLSIAALERAKGTLLRYDNVLMEEDRLGAVARGKVLSNVPPLHPVATPAVNSESETK